MDVAVQLRPSASLSTFSHLYLSHQGGSVVGDKTKSVLHNFISSDNNLLCQHLPLSFTWNRPDFQSARLEVFSAARFPPPKLQSSAASLRLLWASLQGSSYHPHFLVNVLKKALQKILQTTYCPNGCNISSPPFGPISRRAVLSSSDRKNTILSGNCKGTRGEQSVGDLQAQRPGTLVLYVHTPQKPPPNTNMLTHMGMSNTHTHLHPLPHSEDSISAAQQFCCSFPLPPKLLLF